MKRSSIQSIAFPLALGLLLGGCTIKPEYQQPTVPLSEQWVGAALAEQKNALLNSLELTWREFFLDERLQKLIETARTYNHNLKTAALNIELAEAQHGISQANKYPAVVSSGSFNRSRASNTFISQHYRVGLGISNYELDFFGRIKNQNEATLNKYLATKEARNAAQLSIISAVAKTYYQWRISSELQNLAKRTLNTRRKSYQLTKQRFSAGIASGTDISTAQSAIETAKASVQQQARAVQQLENALATLVGKPLDSLDLPNKAKLSKQFPKGKLFADLPAEVLLKRPDIRQAEYGLKSASANIAAARAAMYPTISLTTSVGLASKELGDLFDGGNRTWAFSPGISLPIFDYGRRKANIEVAKINEKILIESYQKAVQSAFQEVNDALVARKTLDAQYQAEKRAQRATAETLRLVKLQVEEGLTDGLRLLDAERTDFAIRQGVLATQLQTLNNRVDLFTALAGELDRSEETTEAEVDEKTDDTTDTVGKDQ